MTYCGQENGLFGPLNEHRDEMFVSPDEAIVVRVALETGGDKLYDYAVPQELAQKLTCGQRVKVPFGKGNRQEVGFCVELPEVASVKRVKVISNIVDPVPLLDSDRMQLARWIAQYYCCPLGQVLSAMVPAAVKRQIGLQKKTYIRLSPKGLQVLSGNEKVRVSTQGQAILACLGKPPDNLESWVDLSELSHRLNCGKGPFNTLARSGLIEVKHCQELAGLKDKISDTKITGTDFELNDAQKQVLGQAEQIIAKNCFNAILLHGVTGSGKTEIYMRCIEKILARGQQALVLVPEIAMTPQTVSRFAQRFGDVAVLHSGLNARQRHLHWRRIAQGLTKVVVGARSAVFAPLGQLGLIVVDEEHEPSYKQDTNPRYHGRDVAIKLGQMKGITVILGSATPSLETLQNCQSKSHYHLLRMSHRVLELPLPKVNVVNMRTESFERKGRHLLSRMLEGELRRCLKAGRQAILLLNRRGHSNFVCCASCQFILTCPNCDVSLTYHRNKRQFETERRSWVMCHYCTHTSSVAKICPVCGKKMVLVGPGTQRAEEELARKLPEAKLQRVDSDAVKPGDYDKILAEFGDGKIDILLGTQMIGKGLDYPNVALVGVLNADTALALPDFRSSERTFQLITQVAGRCGRAAADGYVIVQSYIPEEPAIKLACEHDYEGFSRGELMVRQRCNMPPYHRMARIIMRDRKLKKLEAQAKQLRDSIDKLPVQQRSAIEIRGPMPAGIARIENFHRQQILLKAATAEQIQTLLAKLRNDFCR